MASHYPRGVLHLPGEEPRIRDAFNPDVDCVTGCGCYGPESDMSERHGYCEGCWSDPELHTEDCDCPQCEGEGSET